MVALREPEEIREMKLWAWVGQDDKTGTAEFGLKQGIVPAGCIPLVACKTDKIDQAYVVDQMRKLALLTGKPRYLVRFSFEVIEMTVGIP